jgi:hypothetical protein
VIFLVGNIDRRDQATTVNEPRADRIGNTQKLAMIVPIAHNLSLHWQIDHSNKSGKRKENGHRPMVTF